MRLLGSALRLAAATVLVAAAGLVLPAGPAAAATCASGDGVSVVVDFHELGGGVESACVAGGGGSSATSLFGSAGFGLSYVQRQPEFVCQVSGKPSSACVNTPPANAYWGLWWSDGKSGAWSYATTSASGLSVPEGGYVALSWNGSATRSTPGLSPTAHAVPTPTPSSKPTSKPSGKPSSKPTGKPSPTATKKPVQSASGSPSSTESSTASTPSSSESSTPSASPSQQPSGKAGQPTEPPEGVDGDTLPESAPASTDGTVSTDAAPASSDPEDPSDDGLPSWVGPVVVVALFAAVGATAVVRRRRSPTP